MERQPKSEEDDRTRKKGTLYVYPSRPNLASSPEERDHHQYLPPVVVSSSSSRELKNKVVNMGPANHGDHDGTARRKEEQVVALRRVVTLSPSAKVKLAGVAVSLNVRLRSADMPPIMQERAFRFTRSLLLVNHEITTTTTTTTTNTYTNPTHIARALKKEFDTWYGPAWHCIVGKSFGSFVTHSGGGFLYFSIDKLSVLLFKTAVRPVILDMDRDTDINLLPKQKNLSHNSNTVNLN